MVGTNTCHVEWSPVFRLMCFRLCVAFRRLCGVLVCGFLFGIDGATCFGVIAEIAL